MVLSYVKLPSIFRVCFFFTKGARVILGFNFFPSYLEELAAIFTSNRRKVNAVDIINIFHKNSNLGAPHLC